MVNYHTSGNIKMMRNILIDYGATSDLTPYEYMKSYTEQCPETIDDTKLSWIVETFLGIQKHEKFLREIANHLSEELLNEDQEYFMIVLHAVTFQIPATEMYFLYKTLFNLSKTLLNIFSKFLSNNEVLTFISQVAQPFYDTIFITEKIVGPLFSWQPYISEMAHTYAEYVMKVEGRKIRAPTVPIQPNVLNRKTKDSASVPSQPILPLTPPNSLHKKGQKMLSKSAIDKKLKNVHEKNKQRALHLLNDVKSKDFHYAQPKSDRYYKRVSCIKNDIENSHMKLPKPRSIVSPKTILPPIKDTKATLKRLNKRIEWNEQHEVEWLQNLMSCCGNSAQVEELQAYDRQEKEKERLLQIEKKHLMGQISHEEAILAKKKVQDDNKKKYNDFLKEKTAWDEEIQNWREINFEKNRKYVERLSMFELNLIDAKNAVALKKKETAESLKKESEMIIAKAMQVRQEELERKINMIREIKILSMIARKARVPKIVDLTEISGFGFLCEMSIAELQERLAAMKICLQDELERKKLTIKEINVAAKKDLEEVKKNIFNYTTERAMLRKLNKKEKVTETPSSKEINNLKKILEEKRRLRLKIIC